MSKVYTILLILLLLALTIISIFSFNLIGLAVYGVTLYGIITKKRQILKVWYIGHVITIIISIIISVIASVIVYVIIDMNKNSDDNNENENYDELENISNITKYILIVAYIYTGLAILTLTSIKIYIKKTHISQRQRKDQSIRNNSKHGISIVEMIPESSSSSSRSNSYTQQFIQYERRKSQPIVYPPQTRRLSQQFPQRRQSQPTTRRVSLNNPYLTGSVIPQSPNLSQNSVRLNKSNNSRTNNTQNSTVSHNVSRKSSITQPSIEKRSSLDSLQSNKHDDSKTSIPKPQHIINIENNNQTNFNDSPTSSPLPDISKNENV